MGLDKNPQSLAKIEIAPEIQQIIVQIAQRWILETYAPISIPDKSISQASEFLTEFETAFVRCFV